MAAFREILFPPSISYKSTGGPKFKTSVFALDSGFEARDDDWLTTRAEYDAAANIRDAEDMDVLRAFFLAVGKGRAYGFRYKDWGDYQISQQVIGIGDGETTQFQIIKTYVVSQAQSGIQTSFTRTLKKIAWGTISGLTVGGVTKTSPGDYTVDHNTGLITFTSAPARYAEIKIGTGEFHVPVRFDDDYFSATHEFWMTQTWPHIKLVELRDWTDVVQDLNWSISVPLTSLYPGFDYSTTGSLSGDGVIVHEQAVQPYDTHTYDPDTGTDTDTDGVGGPGIRLGESSDPDGLDDESTSLHYYLTLPENYLTGHAFFVTATARISGTGTPNNTAFVGSVPYHYWNVLLVAAFDPQDNNSGRYPGAVTGGVPAKPSELAFLSGLALTGGTPHTATFVIQGTNAVNGMDLRAGDQVLVVLRIPTRASSGSLMGWIFDLTISGQP